MSAAADNSGAAETQVDRSDAGGRPLRRRYPGVQSFQEDDSSRFFGRRRATEELLLRVLSVRLLLQFAPSGAGKTSLLNAGLCPQLRPHGYLPCNVRLNQPDESLVQAAYRSLKEAARTADLKVPVIPQNAANLWDLLAGIQLWNTQLLLLIPVLIFDQFEEVFTLRDDVFRANVARELGELTRGRRTSAAGIVEVAPDVKLIISLREEYLGCLEEMTVAIPELFRERLRLLPLTAEEAREAIVEPARLDGDWRSPKFAFDAQCIEGLVDFIDGVSPRIRVVEALTLQLVCQRAEEIAIAAATDGTQRLLAMEDFGGQSGLQRLVHRYYKDVLEKLSPTARKKAVILFERGLLDPSGKRLMLEQDEIRRDYGLEEATLNTLVENRLLRREPRNESVFYEITHDRLTDVIAKNRSIRVPQWVFHALILSGVVILALAATLFFVVKSTREEEKARRATTQALDVLLGDTLVLRLREAGLSDALDQVLGRAPPASDPLSHARALRRQGELAFERETLAKAEEKFLRAEGVVRAAVEHGQSTMELTFEHAQVLKGLGDVLLNQGLISRANKQYGEALNVLSTLPRHQDDPMRRLSVIEIQTVFGTTWARLGDLDKADAAYMDALHGGLEVLRVALARPPDEGGNASFLLGRALQVYADATLGRAKLWGNGRDLKSAEALATQATQLRPLSAQARVQLGAASAAYGASGVSDSEAQKANRLLQQSQAQYGELTQFDLRNRRMHREAAAAQLLSAQIIANCSEDGACRKSLQPGALSTAESRALDAAATFGEFSRLDPEDRSYRDDIAWEQMVEAQLRSARAHWAEAMVLVDSALTITKSNLADPLDLDNYWTTVQLLLTRARILDGSGHKEDALGVLNDLLLNVRRLADSKWRRLVETNCLQAQAQILDKMDRKQEAAAAKARSESMMLPGDDIQRVTSQRALELNKEGIALITEAGVAKGVAQLQKIELAEEKYRGALAHSPSDPILWSNLQKACTQAASTMLDQTSAATQSAPDNVAKIESKLRCAAQGAWMAWVLTADADENPRTGEWIQLIIARRSLAMFLRNYAEKEQEARSLAWQNVRDMKVLVTKDTSAEALFLLADAYYGLGLMSESMSEEGWEQEIRAAIISGEQLIDREPNNFARPLWVGQVEHTLAGALQNHHRRGVEAERKRAKDACQEALRLAKTPKETEDAQACIGEAEKT